MTSEHQIIFDTPACDFTESLLIGDGRLGACVYGEVLREQVALNESSMWSGSPEEADRQGAAEYLPKIRRLLREGKNFEAQKLFEEHFTCKGLGTNFAHGTDVPYGCYQMLGRLVISYFQAVSSGRQDSCCTRDYLRVLDLNEARACVSFSLGGRTYTREYLVSADYQALFIHLTCSKPGQIDFTCGLDRDECFEIEPIHRTTSADSAANDFGTVSKSAFESSACDMSCGLYMHGQLADGYETDHGVRYGCGMTVKTKGGQTIQEALRVRVKGADEAWIIVCAQTDLCGFMGKKACVPKEQVISDLRKAYEADWDMVLKKHEEWYRPQFERMELSLGSVSTTDTVHSAFVSANQDSRAETILTDKLQTTKELLLSSIDGEISPKLIELYVQYARYLLICSSRPDGFAANLQGIWSDEILTPWNGDWHLNAQQMIYWIAERANLSENHMPYLKLTGELVAPGEKTAQTYYGARGWLAHTCTNPWGFTSPCEDASWGSTTGSPAWQCHHLWEHYLYTLDQDYLAWAYPIMKGAMLFYLDNMVENEKGYLVTSPSSSPENWFLDEEGRQCALCEGPTYDRALVLALTDSCICAGKILQNDTAFTKELESILPKLAPIEIGSDGRIMEWSVEYKEPFPYHRHLSHLWGAFPGNLISMEQTPDYGQAAAKSLAMRGITTAGWAIALRGCLSARLRNADDALETFRCALKYATAYNLMNLAYHCNETLKNPPQIDREHCRYPFQIDGNQGNAMIVLLMLLDDDVTFTDDGSMITHLYLLPALPKLLNCGSMRGLKAKGNLTVDMKWKDGMVTALTVQGPENARVVLHMNGMEKNIILESGVYAFAAE